MKRLQLRIAHSAETIHPVHEFEIQHPDFQGSELLHWNPSLDETSSMIFRVRGDPGAYRDRLDRRDETLTYTVAPVGDDVFYCCVCERLSDRDRSYVHAVVDRTVVLVPPVRYNQDGTVDVTVVGSPSAIDGVLDELPADAPVDVRSVTEYGNRVPGTVGTLTDRQREAVEAAVESGYYESPRRGRVADVAAELDVSASTAAEHLRKAEAQIMRQVLERG